MRYTKIICDVIRTSIATIINLVVGNNELKHQVKDYQVQIQLSWLTFKDLSVLHTILVHVTYKFGVDAPNLELDPAC
jgi:hypothetical protein